MSNLESEEVVAELVKFANGRLLDEVIKKDPLTWAKKMVQLYPDAYIANEGHVYVGLLDGVMEVNVDNTMTKVIAIDWDSLEEDIRSDIGWDVDSAEGWWLHSNIHGISDQLNAMAMVGFLSENYLVEASQLTLTMWAGKV